MSRDLVILASMLGFQTIVAWGQSEESSKLGSFVRRTGVDLTGRNTTCPQRDAPCWVTLHIWVLPTTTTDDDRRQRPLLVWPPTLCVGGPVISLGIPLCLTECFRTGRHEWSVHEGLLRWECSRRVLLPIYTVVHCLSKRRRSAVGSHPNSCSICVTLLVWQCILRSWLFFFVLFHVYSVHVFTSFVLRKNVQRSQHTGYR